MNIRSKHGSVVISNTAVPGCSGKLKILIEAGADVNATGPYGTTALHKVVSIHNWVAKNENYYKHVEIFKCVRVLLCEPTKPISCKCLETTLGIL